MGDWFEKQTIGSLPARAAARWGEREALYFEGARFSFGRLSQEVDRVARGLIACGVAPGDRVAMWMPNRPEWIAAAYAVMKIGAVLLPVNTRLRSEDLGYILAQSESSTLILAARSGPIDYLDLLKTVWPERLPALRRVIALDETSAGVLGWEQLLALGARASDAELAGRADRVDPEATAFLMYTSGTTGFPKGVMHSHRMVRNVTERGNRMAITPVDRILMYLPLFHMFGFTEGFLMSMLTGARQLLTPTFDADACLDLLQAERATVLHGFDLHYKALIEAQEKRPRDLSSIRTGILAAGMHSSEAIARSARARFGRLLSGYGMTEFGVGGALSALDSSEEQCCEASGYPAPGYDIRIIDPATGRDVPQGVAGEILVRGYSMMRGYYRKPEETAKALDAQGWLHTGDMGILRADGHLRLVGRYKDMLKIGGENVDPMEVESYLMTHPAINLAAVVSYPDERLSEVAVAFVRLEPGRTLAEAEVIAHCRGRMASYKVPRRVLFVEEFPTTSSGKIQKALLREEALRRLP